MSAAVAILPLVWATADLEQEAHGKVPNGSAPVQNDVVEAGVAFYRKYTEALLRRYVRLAMEAGRAPSLVGREMFRGKVTHYKVKSFDDVVIFVHDVERCLAELEPEQEMVIERIAMQEYTHGEASELIGLPVRTLIRRYQRALDVLTKMFLERRILEPQRLCQEGSSWKNRATH